MPAVPSRRLARFAWVVLGYNLLVILWGAAVRATGSGAGCGRHWPTCDGQLIPSFQSVARVIEYSHRVSSGVALLLVVALGLLAFRDAPRRGPVRKAALVANVFMFGEAVLGAMLVLFEKVGLDASLGRALFTALHLNNTFLLLAALATTAWLASGGTAPRLRGLGDAGQADWVRWPLVASLLGVMLLGTSGAVAALGDTLYPAASLRAGLAQDFSTTAHLFVRLRVLHPMIALLAGALVVAAAVAARRARRGDVLVDALARAVGALFVAQLGAGLVNLVLLAPVWMQLVHLLVADALWLGLVLLTLATLRAPRTA